MSDSSVELLHAITSLEDWLEWVTVSFSFQEMLFFMFHAERLLLVPSFAWISSMLVSLRPAVACTDASGSTLCAALLNSQSGCLCRSRRHYHLPDSEM